MLFGLHSMVFTNALSDSKFWGNCMVCDIDVYNCIYFVLQVASVRSSAAATVAVASLVGHVGRRTAGVTTTVRPATTAYSARLTVPLGK